MLVIPSIDVMDGKCVRLVQGDPAKMKIYSDNPVSIAKRLKSEGAELIHLIDLDAALGLGQNSGVIKEILRLPVNFQVGGGIRTLEKAEKYLKLGAFRVIFGTAALKNPRIVEEAVHRFGSEHIAVAIDEKDGKTAFHGWKESSDMDYLDFAKLLELMNVGCIIFTPTSVDGTLKGPPINKTRRLVESLNTPVIASGGIGSLEDLCILAKIGVIGAVVGTALYEGKFSLEEALEAVEKC
jgi:phosphoribosylformimino-5-aminoimidazole carboxamide ribotide isomerase